MSNILEEKKKRYEVSSEVEQVANKVIAEKSLNFNSARIKYVKVFPSINKKTAGRCIVARPMIKLFGDCDYVIQVSGDFWDKLDDLRKEILMWHELMHVFPVQNQKTGEWDFRIKDHDINDFFVIIKTHGIDWLSDLKTLFSSVYDLDNADDLSL